MKIINLLMSLAVVASAGIAKAGGPDPSGRLDVLPVYITFSPTLSSFMSTAMALENQVILEAAENDAIEVLMNVGGQSEKSQELILAIQVVNDYLTSQDQATVDDLTASYIIVRSLNESRRIK